MRESAKTSQQRSYVVETRKQVAEIHSVVPIRNDAMALPPALINSTMGKVSNNAKQWSTDTGANCHG